MKESDWKYLVDALLYACLVAMAAIGALMAFVIPEGPVSAEGTKYFLGLHRHQWGDIHARLSLAFVVFLAVHLVLSWKWIKIRSRCIFKRASAPALAAIALLPFFLLALLWAVSPKDSEKYRSYGLGAGERQRAERLLPREAEPQAEAPAPPPAGVRAAESPPAPPPEHAEQEKHERHGRLQTLTGRNTFRDIESMTGIPASVIISRMGLPPETPTNETLGRLRRLYGFEIEDVRILAERLLKEQGSGRD